MWAFCVDSPVSASGVGMPPVVDYQPWDRSVVVDAAIAEDVALRWGSLVRNAIGTVFRLVLSRKWRGRWS